MGDFRWEGGPLTLERDSVKAVLSNKTHLLELSVGPQRIHDV